MTSIKNQQTPTTQWKRYTLGGLFVAVAGIVALIANRQYIATTSSRDIIDSLSTTLYVLGIIGSVAGIVCLAVGASLYAAARHNR